MAIRISILLMSAAALLFCGNWVITREAKWEPVLSAIASLVSVIVALWGLLKKKEPVKSIDWEQAKSVDREPGELPLGLFVGTKTTKMHRKEPVPNNEISLPMLTIKEIREQLLLTTNNQERLQALLAHAYRLRESEPSVELDQLIVRLQLAIDFVEKDYQYYYKIDTHVFEKMIRYEHSANRRNLLLWLVWMGIVGFLLYKIIRYYILNW